MLVMLLGQTRVLYSMGQRRLVAEEILRRGTSQVPYPVQEHHARWPARRDRGSITPIDDIGKMVNIGTLLAFVIVCIAVMILRNTNPIKRARFVRRGCRLFQFWAYFSTAI